MRRLSERLTAIENLVPKTNVLADIGCDHGYLPIALCEQQRIKKAIATDIHQGPLQRAKEHIAAAGLCLSIETRLSNGLEKLNRQEADVIVIAGMGGETILQILKAYEDIWEQSLLILQPQSQMTKLRRYIMERRMIDAEDMVYEDGKYYTLFRASLEKGPTSFSSLLEQEAKERYGLLDLLGQKPLFLQYLDEKEKNFQNILAQIHHATRKSEILHELEILSFCRSYIT